VVSTLTDETEAEVRSPSKPDAASSNANATRGGANMARKGGGAGGEEEEAASVCGESSVGGEEEVLFQTRMSVVVSVPGDGELACVCVCGVFVCVCVPSDPCVR
jgi:hypothetical protein